MIKPNLINPDHDNGLIAVATLNWRFKFSTLSQQENHTHWNTNMTLTSFRTETRQWLEANCPASMRIAGDQTEVFSGGTKQKLNNPDTKIWFEAMLSKGWTAPNWPKEYGGGGLSFEEHTILKEEMQRIGARTPLAGMGMTMIGPTLLDHGNAEQKARHLPKIIRGEVRWCQGYSEPGAGSDLASLKTRAVAEGDHFIINGSKIWASGAQYADWIFCLVRTDPEAPKHQGISFLLFPMDQTGVTVKPIKLISGSSPFCETFFDNAKAHKDDLVGTLNQGWTVAKRLLQHERSSISGLTGNGRAPETGMGLIEAAKTYIGLNQDDELDDTAIREKIARHRMKVRAYRLTQKRAMAESADGGTPGATTSIFKYYGGEQRKYENELQLMIRGHHGFGWQGDEFSADELTLGRAWLRSKSASIAGGTSEVQLNIIAKRVLGLPD